MANNVLANDQGNPQKIRGDSRQHNNDRQGSIRVSEQQNGQGDQLKSMKC